MNVSALKTASKWVGVGYLSNVPLLLAVHAKWLMWAVNAGLWVLVFAKIYHDEKKHEQFLDLVYGRKKGTK